MPTNVVIPSLGLTMEEGTIVKWFKQAGDRVDKDEPIVLIETDKATADVNAPAGGLLGTICANEGDVIPVGDKIAVIYSPEEYIATKDGPAADLEPSHAEVAPPASSLTETVAQVGEEKKQMKYELTGFIKASPAAKKLARELRIDLQEVTGSGPDGRILEHNVSAYRERFKAATVTAKASPLTGMRKMIAKRMSLSRHTTAPVTIFMEVRMDEAVKLRSQMNAGIQTAKGYKIMYDALIAKAVSIALQDHPNLQAQWDENRLIHPDGVHLGIAVALEGGLVVPVVRHTQNRSLFSIAKEIGNLAEAAKRGDLPPDATSGGTFTISNLGMYPLKGFTPVINLPEAAILGIGAIKPQALVENDKVTIGQTAEFSLTFDHRIIDGAPAAAFLSQIKSLLEQPYQLFIEEF